MTPCRVLSLAATFAVLMCLGGCGSNSNSNNNPPPVPTPSPQSEPLPAIPPNRRNKLYFTYFGCDDAQTDQVLDHVNMWFEPCWGGLEGGIARIAKVQLPTIFVITSYVYQGGNPLTYVGTEACQTGLRSLFTRLREADVLKYVAGVYPIDEPDLNENNIPSETIIQANTDIRAVLAEFPELAQCKIVVTYGGSEDYRGIGSYDWVGFDDYGQRESIFTNGKYDRLKQQLTPQQGITLFPGGGNPWRQDPRPFYMKAIEDDQVVAIIPFIWIDRQTLPGGDVGIHSNGAAPAYREVGQSIKNG